MILCSSGGTELRLLVLEGNERVPVMPSVSVNNLRVEYNKGRTTALDDLNLEIGDGEFCVFLGPSGCGKTTALLCIAGLIVPTNGDVSRCRAGNINCKKVFVRPQERNIAMVFQEYALIRT